MPAANRRKESYSLEYWVNQVVNELDKGISVVGSSSALSYMVNDILASTPWINFKHPAPLTERQREWLFDVTQHLATAYAYLPPFTDILGPIYMQYSSRHSKAGLGQFFTPPQICDVMSEIVYATQKEEADQNVIKYNEPSVGSGSMPLSLCRLIFRKNPEDLLRLHCYMGDLDILCCKMTAVQFVMNFVAFRICPIAGYIYHGDSLGDPELYISWQAEK